ncbi:hypothetical protein V8C86DRAFT_2550299 [Haematococcus lacustris]
MSVGNSMGKPWSVRLLSSGHTSTSQRRQRPRPSLQLGLLCPACHQAVFRDTLSMEVLFWHCPSMACLFMGSWIQVRQLSYRLRPAPCRSVFSSWHRLPQIQQVWALALNLTWHSTQQFRPQPAPRSRWHQHRHNRCKLPPGQPKVTLQRHNGTLQCQARLWLLPTHHHQQQQQCQQQQHSHPLPKVKCQQAQLPQPCTCPAQHYSPVARCLLLCCQGASRVSGPALLQPATLHTLGCWSITAWGAAACTPWSLCPSGPMSASPSSTQPQPRQPQPQRLLLLPRRSCHALFRPLGRQPPHWPPQHLGCSQGQTCHSLSRQVSPRTACVC